MRARAAVAGGLLTPAATLGLTACSSDPLDPGKEAMVSEHQVFQALEADDHFATVKQQVGGNTFDSVISCFADYLWADGSRSDMADYVAHRIHVGQIRIASVPGTGSTQDGDAALAGCASEYCATLVPSPDGTATTGPSGAVTIPLSPSAD